MGSARIDPNDIVGRKIGRLLVKTYDGYYDLTGNNRKKHWYSCECECGNAYLARRDHLLEGRVRSCGNCRRIEAEGDHLKYITSKGESFIFDKQDYETAVTRAWCISRNGSCDGKQYVVARGDDGRIILFSRTIIELDDDSFVDHRNGNTLDNRRCNLREASVADNARNTSLRSDNKTGYKGVGFLPHNGRYRAYIGVDGRFISLGNYDDPKDAARAYDEAARFYFGDFACVNFPKDGEQGCLRKQMA